MLQHLRLFFCITITGTLFSNNLNAQTNGPVVIPVVFHILNIGGAENISDAQVTNEMQILNEDYNKQNADTAFVIPAYKNNIANMGITFRLANIAPDGNCTNGIEHIFTTETDSGGNTNAFIGDWPRDKYLNIWTYNRFAIPGQSAITLFPWFADDFPQQDGIAILSNYIGSIGTGSEFTSRALTNTVGHYFGLLEIAPVSPNAPGNFCIDADSVADTPPLSSLFTPTANCDTIVVVSCDTPFIANLQNFMDYSYCNNMFTNGQRARVYSFLNRSQRDNLWTPLNLAETGTNSSIPVQCPTGISKVLEGALTVYPNPFNSQIVINGLSMFQYHISILDITGRTLLAFPDILPDKNGSATIDLAAIHVAGMYFIRLTDDSGVSTLKIMKQ